MDLYDVMRTTFAARDFTDDPVPDEVLHRIFDNARFAPSGGNRQGQKVIVVRDPDRKKKLGLLCDPALRVYDKQRQAGEFPWNTIIPTKIDVEEARNTPSEALPIFRAMDDVPVVLVVTVDLRRVASTRQRARSDRCFQWRLDLPVRVEHRARGPQRGLRRDDDHPHRQRPSQRCRNCSTSSHSRRSPPSSRSANR